MPLYGCRYTFATMLKGTEAADMDKMRLMGHGSMQMTKLYTRSHTPELRAAIDGIEVATSGSHTAVPENESI